MQSAILFLLLGAGGLVLAIYFSSFARTMKSLSPEELDRYVKQNSVLYSLPGVIPILVIPFIENLAFRGVLAALSLVVMTWLSRLHHRRLLRLGFDSAFVGRLRHASLIGAVGLVAALGGLILMD